MKKRKKNNNKTNNGEFKNDHKRYFYVFLSLCSKYCVDLYGAAIHSNFYHSLMYVKVNNNIQQVYLQSIHFGVYEPFLLKFN